MYGGGFPPPKIWCNHGQTGRINGLVSPSSSPPVPGTPQRGSYAVPQRPRGLSCSYVDPHWGAWLPNAASHLLPSHAASACDPPATVAPAPPCTPSTVPDPSSSTGRNYPLPSSVSHTPPPTSFHLPGTGIRPFQLSFWHFYSSPPCQTALLGWWNAPGDILVPMTRPCHHPVRRENVRLYVSDDDIYL